MRVVGGEARGRRLVAPSGRSTRPTSDYVREAMFNVLGSLGPIEGLTVLDLFAGSGALGIEALSRGASRATFVESDRAAVESIRANLESLGMSDRARVVRLDALRFLEEGGTVDLAFVDPPYAFADWPSVLERLRAGTAVLESGSDVDVGAGWRVLKSKHYGSTVVTVAQPAGAPE